MTAEVQESKAGATDDDPSNKEYWRKIATRTFMSHVFLIPEPASETALVTAIQGTPLAKLRGTPGRCYVGVHFDARLSGESSSKPSLRTVPLSDDQYCKVMKAAIVSRSGNEAELLEGDVYLLQAKSGQETTMMKPFYMALEGVEDGAAPRKGVRKICESLTTLVLSDEASLRKRCKAVKDGTRFKLYDPLFVLSLREFEIPDMPRKNYPGSTLSDTLGPVVWRPFEEHAQITWAAKKKLFGKALKRVGGAGPATGEETERRKDDTKEPCFFHQPPVALAQELLHSFGLKLGVLDLTVGEGIFAEAALELQLIYVGVVFNEVHMEFVKSLLIDKILEKMADESSKLYDVRYCLFLKSQQRGFKRGGDDDKPRKDSKDPKKEKKDKKGKKKVKKKVKKVKKCSESASETSSSSPEDSRSEDE